MNNKTNKKNWIDVKALIAALGFLFTLWLWNSFSKDLATKALVQYQPTDASDPGMTAAAPVASYAQPTPFTRVLMGGAAPQVYQADNPASQPITQTSSSK